MNIEQIELIHIRMPLVSPFETSFGVTRERECLIVRALAGGAEGWGECVADAHPGYSYETVTTARHLLRDYLAPALLAAPVDDPRDLPARFAPVRGHPMAKAALEAAAWDLAAQQAGRSLRECLGGVRERVPVGVSIGIQASPASLAETAARYRAQGYRRIKIKIKPGRDLEDARAARAALGDTPLMVDANSAYTLADAGLFQNMDDLGLLMIEQPLGYDDIHEHSQLQPLLRTPLCLDESIHSAGDARFAIAVGACRIINIKQGRVGGLTNAVALHDACRERGVPVWCGGMLETGIGRALNVALASLPNFTLPGDLSASNRYYAEDLIDPPFELNADGTLSVPTGPGLGVRVSARRLERVTLNRETVRP
jgi:O-succinylbenzoate synthase